MTKADAASWRSLIKEIGVVACVIITTYGAIIGTKNRETVKQISAQTDGTMTAAKLEVAILAEFLAKETGKPEYQKKAEEARAAYETQRRNQENAER